MKSRKRLLFRRQFILGPRFSRRLRSWNRIKINDSLALSVHPHLPVCQTEYKNKSLTLLGYILDPHNPQSKDIEILSNLLRQSEFFQDLYQLTYDLGGRWIFIFNNLKETVLFHDPAGLRQVFYTISPVQEIWCASTPGVIAQELDLRIDEEAGREFIESPQLKRNLEYWWPGDSSPFKEIKHLLPNHHLDLRKRIVRRCWPTKGLDHITPEEGVAKSSDILKGLFRSACNRFELALALTAGWDTRVLLSASKEMSLRVFYYSLIYFDLCDNSPDIKIPSKLLSNLGLKHNVIRCPHDMDSDFEKIYKTNVTTAHNAYGPIAQGLHNQYPQDRVCIKGNVSEIARCFYRLSNFEHVNGANLARLAKMQGNSFAIKSFEKWLLEAKESAEACDINILDLFYWEQKMGNWQAMSQSEWDIAQEVFCPFNCRSLITTLLSVDEPYRRPPEYKLYKELIMNLWPETLSEPINPSKGLKTMIKKILLKTNLYAYYSMIRSWNLRTDLPQRPRQQ